MQKETVRIAVVGLRHGTEHLDHYRGRPDVEVVGICDATESLLRQTGEKYGVPARAWFTDYQEMLRKAQPDAVYVMTPVPLHAQMTIQALEAGSHALVAKSLCRNLSEGEAMLRARDKAGKQVEVGFQMHYTPVYRHVREHLHDEKFGELRGAWIQYFSPSYVLEPGHWQNRMESMGGSLLDCGIHSMDAMLYLLNRPWQRVLSVGRQILEKTPDRDTMDAATTLIELDNGVRVTFDFIDSRGHSYVRSGIVGSRGKFEIDHWDPHGSGHVKFSADARSENPVSIWVPPKESSTGHIGIVEESLHFLEVCQGRAQSLSTLESALESLSAQLAIVASLRRGGCWVNREEISEKRWR